MLDTGWSFACPDWEAKLRAGRTPIPDLPLDPVEAGVAVALLDKLRLPDVQGQPTFGAVGGEWVRDIVRAAFGSVDPVTQLRRVGELMVLIPKKNGKTTNSAALGLIALQMNRTPNIDGMIVGPTQEVADKCFAQAVGMIEADEYLRKRFHVIEHKKTIVDLYRDPDTGVQMNARLKVKSFDLKVVTGSIPAFAIVDELHLMSQSAAATRILAQIRGGMITNPRSLLVIITTQSDVQPVGAFRDELMYARGVRDGRITSDVRMLPILYEFSETMQREQGPKAAWRDPANWPLVLPNIGRSVHVDRLVGLYETARQKGAADERLWASQHLNVEIGVALHAARWRGADYWEGTVEADLSLDELLSRAEVVTVGLDGGGLDDLLGMAVIGRCRATRHWLVWGHAWAQPSVLEERKEIAETLQDFAAEGDLTICEAVTQDVLEVAELVEQVAATGLLPEKAGIGIDPVAIAAITDELEARDLGGERIVAVPQGFRLSSAVWGAERKLADGTLRHGGQRMMAWCVGNAKAEQKGNAVLIEKSVAGKAKIDPLIAMFNAFQLMGRSPEAAGVSVYQERGLLTV